MRKKSIHIVLFILLYLVANQRSLGQARVDTTSTAEFLVKEILVDQGILAGNVSYTGAKHAIGYFEDPSSQLNIEEGIILTTGNVFFALGPNQTPRSGWASNLPGDENLDKITRGVTYDACVLEFDFIATSEVLTFEYVFASEEYMEYVGSKFNDVFGFFLSGPGIDQVNLAKLDNGLPITINNINSKSNPDFYIDNPVYNNYDAYVWDVRKRQVIKNKKFGKPVKDPVYQTQFDGFTVVLTAKYDVIPNEIYHIKLAVADVSDGILDSGVILKGKSFRSSGEQIVAIDKVLEKREEVVVDLIPGEDLVRAENEVQLQSTQKFPGNEPLHIMNVEFEFDKYNLTDTSYITIHNVSQILQSDESLIVEVVGHADNIGPQDYNYKLSEYRSNSVINHLVKLGVQRTRIVKEYHGEDLPLNSNQTTQERAKNRRVEFRIVKKS